MAVGAKPPICSEAAHERTNTALQSNRGREILHGATRTADEMVVVAAGNGLIKLVASELIGTRDAVHHAGLAEHGQVPVGGALGE